MNKFKIIALFFTLFFIFNIVFVNSISGCKDIIAAGDATEGDYNLLMKVRDPSRPGLQVLCIIPEGYEYNYRHPWTGKTMSFRTDRKYIGVASKDDVIPNIVKAGMTLSDAGIAYGDSDTDSRWINPTRNAWDDFDWIRYACQTANTEDEAVKLLTEDAVKKMHATGVSENLFVVGPNKGFVVEGDAFHYKVEEIENGVSVRHNYPKLLWKTQRLKLLPISRTFDKTVEKTVRKNGAIRLGSIYGIRVVEIGEDYVCVRPIGLHALKTKNIGVITRIQLDERQSVGKFSVKLLEINDNKAKLSVCNIYKAWENEIMKHIQAEYGNIDVSDMIKWSRYTNEDLDGLRGMSQKNREFEAVAIYKIPKQNYEQMSMGWFSANNALSSIYVPFHISNTDIFDPYENGQAAQLSIDLLNTYDNLTEPFSNVEEVFLYEIESMEKIILDENQDTSEFLTTIDMGMQRQAYYTQDLWMEIKDICNEQEMKYFFTNMWNSNYSTTMKNMKNIMIFLDETTKANYFIEKIQNILFDICKTRIDAAKIIDKQSLDAENEYSKGKELIEEGKLETGFGYIKKAYYESTMLMNGKTFNYPKDEAKKDENKPYLFVSIILILIVILLLTLALIKKR